PLLVLLVLVVFTTTASAAGAVLGLDFGTLNIKAALIKPGVPNEIVLTKDSKRKETAAVAFKPRRDSSNNVIAEVGSFPERAYGSDALALQGRMPGEVFPNLKPLLGLPWTEDGSHKTVEVWKGRYPAVQVVQVKELGTTVFKSSAFAEGEVPWSVEELLAMELASVRRNAEGMAGGSVEDVVITIPVFYTADEKRAIERAATLAGFEVNALISDGLAVGLDYAKSRTFPDVSKGEKPEYHIVYDMGAGSTTATLLRFQSRSVKDVGRFNKTVQEVAVVGAGWDRTLGGDAMNQVIVDDYVSKFLTKPVMKSRGLRINDVKENGRIMSRLWKEAEKARQVLSANTETSSSFEELMPEIDFRTKLTRSGFEELMESFAERVTQPIRDALSAAKMEMADIDSIILFGGALRTPFVHRKLEEIAGGSAKLRSNVNADESAVFGASFKGATLSPSFKVKEIRDSDIAAYAAGMTYTDAGKDRRQQLFVATSPVGSGSTTKQITFKDKEDFTFALYQVVDGADRPITRIQTSNLTASIKELKERFGCDKDDIATKFSVRLSSVDGLPEVLGGTVSCEVEGTGKSGSLVDSAKDWLGFGGKKDQDPLKDDPEDAGPVEEVDAASSTSGAADESAKATSGSASTSSPKVPEKPKKRTESTPIAFTTSPEGNVQSADEELQRMQDRLAAFDRSDQARLAREEALNQLESYTYYVRDFLGNSEYTSYATDVVREQIRKLLDTTRSFMESSSDVSKATEATLRDRLSDLKKLVEPIQARRKEELARPEKVALLKTSLNETERLIGMIKEQIAKGSEASSKAAQLEASKTAAASSSETDDLLETGSPSAADDFADLEADDAPASSSSTKTKSDGPKYSSPSDFTPYTAADLTELEEAYAETREWLAEKEAEQDKLGSNEDPVLLLSDLEVKGAKLSRVMSHLVYK
ncbi:hypothetical protein BAUCODRAFT_43750, partial [Baudoinia panamericana UAMH 10762]